MDNNAYVTHRDAATGTLTNLWVAYCTRQDPQLLRDFKDLQFRLEVAQVHAAEQNFRAAVGVLPPTVIKLLVLPPWQVN